MAGGLGDERLQARDSGVHIPAMAQRAGRPRHAVGGERTQCHLESLALDGIHAEGGGIRVNGPVKHQRAHVGREQLRVPGAQVGPVRLAEVGELAVAERGAQHVHVPRGALRAHVGQQRPGVPLASTGEELALRDDHGQLRRIGRGVVGLEIPVQLRPGHAVHSRLTAAYATRVESNHVEPGAHGGGDDALGLQRVADAGAARAARVDHQRAGPLGRIRGGEPDDRQ